MRRLIWGILILALALLITSYLYVVKRQPTSAPLPEFTGSLKLGQTLPPQSLLLRNWEGAPLYFPLPLYPSGKVTLLEQDKDGPTLSVNLVTTDSFSTVKEYYSAQLRALGKVDVRERAELIAFRMGERGRQLLIIVMPTDGGQTVISAAVHLVK